MNHFIVYIAYLFLFFSCIFSFLSSVTFVFRQIGNISRIFAYSHGFARFYVCKCVCASVSLSVYLSVKIVRIGHTLAKIKNVVYIPWHLPSNVVIAKIALRDFTYFFGGNNLQFLDLWKGKSCDVWALGPLGLWPSPVPKNNWNLINVWRRKCLAQYYERYP